MNLAKCWLTSSVRNREQHFRLIVVRMCHPISQQTLVSSGQRISICLSSCMLPNTLEWHNSWIKPTLLEVFVLPFVFLVSYFFSLGTKQAIKSHVYDHLEVNEVLKEGMKGKVKLGAVKYQILQFLTQLTVVLPKSFW